MIGVGDWIIYDGTAWEKVDNQAAASITITGDASGTGAGTIPLTLANTGVSTGTFTKVTVDSKGRVLVGAHAATVDLTDVQTTGLANNQIFSYNFSTSKWVNAHAPYDVYGTFIGKPSDGQSLWWITIGRAITFPINLAGSVASCRQEPATDVSMPILQNGVQIGSIEFGSGQSTGTFTFSSAVTFVTGDILEVDGPSPVDFTFFGPSWSFIGYR